LETDQERSAGGLLDVKAPRINPAVDSLLIDPKEGGGFPGVTRANTEPHTGHGTRIAPALRRMVKVSSVSSVISVMRLAFTLAPSDRL
jgi:hypothetical protein